MSPKGRNRNQTDVQAIVIKQPAYGENDTSLYIQMKPMIKFYATILSYLEADFEDEQLVKQLVEVAQKIKPSWETTEESVVRLEQAVNRGSEIEDDDELYSILNDFNKAAFRDLSVIKDDAAMDVFQRLASKVSATFSDGEDMLVWAKSVKDRPDGSGVIVLHVSDLKRFRKLIEDHDLVDNSTEDGTLENGVVIGS